MHGTFYVTHAVGRRWIAGGNRGNVVSIVVTWIGNGSPYVVPSAMSKSAVHAMTMSLAHRMGSLRHPPQRHRAGRNPDRRAGKRLTPGGDPARSDRAHNPMGRVGRIEELQNLATFLMSGRLRLAHRTRPSRWTARKALATGGNFYELRHWTDAQWQAAREPSRRRTKKTAPSAARSVQPRGFAGTSANTRSGLPLPSWIFSGAATMSAPVAGSRSRLHRHCRPYLPAPCM